MLQKTHQKGKKTIHRTGEKFASHIPDREYVSGIHKELLQLKLKRQITQLIVCKGSEYMYFQRRYTDNQ